MGKGTLKQKNQALQDESRASQNADNGYNFRGNSARQPGVFDTKNKR